MDKVIFLDIDGVLNSKKWFVNNNFRKQKFEIDPDAVKLLNHVIRKTDAKIVISSTWRMGREINWFRYMFNEIQLYGNVVGKTRSFNHNKCTIPRGTEIEDYCKECYGYPSYFEEHPSRLKSYVILDDDSDMLYNQKDNFINTTFEYGLQEKHIPMIISILNTDLKSNYSNRLD